MPSEQHTKKNTKEPCCKHVNDALGTFEIKLAKIVRRATTISGMCKCPNDSNTDNETESCHHSQDDNSDDTSDQPIQNCFSAAENSMRTAIGIQAINSVAEKVRESFKAILHSKCSSQCCESAAPGIANNALGIADIIISTIFNPTIPLTNQTNPAFTVNAIVQVLLSSLSDAIAIHLSTVTCPPIPTPCRCGGSSKKPRVH